MPNEITIIKGAGGLGRPLDGADFVSSYLHYTSVLPSGFSSSDRIKTVFSVAEAEALGITDESLGETPSTATYQLTNKGAAGDVILCTVADINSTIPDNSVTTLASYTTVTADVATLITAAAKLASEINDGTTTHGYTAVSDGVDTVTITAAAGQGIFLNTGTPYAVTVTAGSTAGTLVQNVVAGVASEINIMHYHVSEYFRAQPKGKLSIGIYETSTDFAEVNTIQDYREGEIRQMGVYTQAAFATADVDKLQTQAALAETNYKPLSILIQSDFSAVTDLTLLSDLHTLSDPKVSVTIGQDGEALGYKLFLATGKSIGTVGITLGALSFGKVSDSIAHPAKFQMASGELDSLAFANGSQFSGLSNGQIDAVDDKGYVFLKKHFGLSGSYFDNDYTAVAVSSDYARVKENRVIDKASRNVRSFLLPSLASPLKLNDDGTMREDTVAYFKSLCNRALEQMERDDELSAFGVTIDPLQNVLSTSKLEITISIVPIASADNIEVNIGFTTSL